MLVPNTLQITARNQGDLNFMELVLRVAAATRPTFLVLPIFEPTNRRIGAVEVFGSIELVEVGANLGDCALWTLAHLGRR